MDEQAYKALYGHLEVTLNRRINGLHKTAHPDNARELERFVAHLRAKGISPARQLIYVERVGKFARFLKTPFRTTSRSEMEAVVERMRKHEGAWSMHTHGTCIRAFYRWLFELEQDERLPDCIRWFRTKGPPSTLRNEDLPTEEEVARMISAARSERQKLFVSLIFECGPRPGETMSIRARDVKLKALHAKIYVSGKTRGTLGERPITVVKSFSLLKSVVSSLKPSDFLFANRFGGPWSLVYGCNLVQQLARKAGVKKHLTPYRFRHRAATWTYSKVGGPLGSQQIGHVSGSRMIQRYLHLGEDAAEKGIMKAYGIAEDAEQASGNCPSCNRPYGYAELVCNCGQPLTAEGELLVETKEDKKTEDLEKRLKCLEALVELERRLDTFCKKKRV
ncbi:MAG: tyrosine-type recombinase/integrase [Candidatus ainarchaeum sp.]|nr:tyrosine-type recombinase/integrase [Candidatus ainarchaeum sp.]